MPKYQDDIGVWNQLGAVKPELFGWVKYPTLSDGSTATLRLRVSASNPDAIESVCWIRSRFTTARTDQVTQAIKFYPKTHVNEKLIISMPIPPELLERSIYIRSIEIKKSMTASRYPGRLNDDPYVVYIDELWSV